MTWKIVCVTTTPKGNGLEIFTNSELSKIQFLYMTPSKICHLSPTHWCIKESQSQEWRKIWNNMSLISRVPMRKNRLSFLVHSWESCPVNGAFFHASDTWDMEGKKLVLLCGFSTIRIHCKHINVWWMMTPCTVYDNSSHALLRENHGSFQKESHPSNQIPFL